MKAHSPRELVLVGGGHSHVQVLRKWAMAPEPGVRLTVVLDRSIAVYSGMVPGYVAGQYGRDEVEIDVRPLARRAGARVIHSAAVGVDPAMRTIQLAGRPPVAYDVASLNVGSTVRGTDLPGVAKHALASRPIHRLLEEVDARVQAVATGTHPRVIVVGAGAGGVELAFCLRQRLKAAGCTPKVTLLDGGPRPLAALHPRVSNEVVHALTERDIAFLGNVRVICAEADAVTLDDGRTLPVDLLVWVAGAAARPFLEESGLPVDDRGFVRVDAHLQVQGCPGLFAVGDCTSFTPAPLPKAGVYAVRMGPVLHDNLRASLQGGDLQPYTPQDDFLVLLNLGDGTAIGTKWGLARRGPEMFALKDRIDRQFMAKFQVLDPDGGLRAGFEDMPGMDEMICGGCAAKVGQTSLERVLGAVEAQRPRPSDPTVLLGLDAPDDAAVTALPGGGVALHTVDVFRPFTDDPWLVGKVAAVNAVSDLLAKGVTPRHALAIVAVPDGGVDPTERVLTEVMLGMREVLDALGTTLIGGHTTTAPELLVGLSLTGYAESLDDVATLGGLRPGDALVLTRALGTGVLFHADGAGRAAGRWVEAALDQMVQTNAAAAEVARVHATASTDVTGFGLAGHLGEMVRQSGCSAVVRLGALPLLPGVATLLAAGERSTFHPENARAARALALDAAASAHPVRDAIFDPQTSGGLLLGVPADAAEACVAALHAAGCGEAAVIGHATAARDDGALFAVEG